jgi:hypothetical protein
MLETFERVLNNGVIVIHFPKDQDSEPVTEAVKPGEEADESRMSTHPLFLGETWKVRPAD